MAHREKDFSSDNHGDSATHNGALNPDYPTAGDNGDSSGGGRNGSFTPVYPQASSTGHQHLDSDHDSGAALHKIRTAGSISISPALFEKLYLSPENRVKGDLRKTFANPTPLALVGFLLSLTPLSCDLMGWRGAGGLGASDTGAYYAFGGVLMLLGSLLEFVLGNTFPFIVFGSFGAFWVTYALTLTPYINASGAYAPTDPISGSATPQFAESFGFFFVWMGLLCLIYLICSLRTNLVFVTIFFTLVLAFGFLTGTEWQAAKGNAALSAKLLQGAGACAFVTCMAGWWIFLAQLLASVDFPVQLPVGDLSGFIKGATDRQKDYDA